jgi:hypothetical protein
VRRQPNNRPRPDELPGDRGQQIVLAEVQHVGSGRVGDVRPVIDGQQRPVRRARQPEHLQVPKFLASLQALLPQLDDVYAMTEDVIQEARQVALALPGIRA